MSVSTAASRAALTIAGVLSLTLTMPTSADAQTAAPRTGRWELRLPSGGFIATGEQRDHLKDAEVTAAQLSWRVRPRLAITGTFAWARSRDLATTGSPKLDVFSSDLGIETHSGKWSNGGRVSMTAFAGAGAGARSYNYRKLDVDATNNLAGYLALGGEIARGRVGLRLEARDYVSGFRPLVGAGQSEARNDVLIMGALRFNRR